MEPTRVWWEGMRRQAFPLWCPVCACNVERNHFNNGHHCTLALVLKEPDDWPALTRPDDKA